MTAKTHTRTFRVRHYECDAYGHMNNVNYLRFMQEAAIDASSAVGYPMERYAELGQGWLIRESQIEYLKPVRYDQRISVKTWIEDSRRFRSKRLYEFRADDAEDLVAQASTDWVYVDAKTGRPINIPDEMIAAFFEDGKPLGNPKRDPFPKAPPTPTGAVQFTQRVAWRDIDELQHVNNANYLAICEEAGIEALCQYNWPLERLLAEGYGWAARTTRIEYKAQPTLGDELEITTYLAAAKRTRARRWYFIRIKGTNELAAQAYTDWVFIDINTGRPTRVPAELMTDLAPHLATEE